MRKKTILVLAVSLPVLGAGAGAWFLWPTFMEVFRGGQNGEVDLNKGKTGNEDHDHVKGEEEQDGADLAMSIEEILKERCEHGIPTHQCAECRYEVGVVKVDSSLMKDPSAGKFGLVDTIVVAEKKMDNVLSLTGEVQMNENTAAHIHPRISGVIQAVMVDLGEQVKKGDMLFELDSVDLGKALSEFEKSRAMVELSRKNFEREKALLEKKIGLQQDLIDSEMNYKRSLAEFKAAEQQLHVLGLSHEDIALSESSEESRVLGRLPTRAPFDGTIIEKHAVIGELVQPDRKVMLIADLHTLWVWADIYEENLSMLLQKRKKGKIPVEIFVHAFSGRAFKGEIDYIGATMNEQTRTVKVRITVDNDELLLRPGMFCEIHVYLTTAKKVLAIPKIALVSDEGREFVFKHMYDNYFVRRLVKRGRKFDENVEILAGLMQGERIVAGGAFLLKSDVLRSKMGAGCAD